MRLKYCTPLRSARISSLQSTSQLGAVYCDCCSALHTAFGAFDKKQTTRTSRVHTARGPPPPPCMLFASEQTRPHQHKHSTHHAYRDTTKLTARDRLLALRQWE